MNILKKILGSGQKDDLVVIPSGQLIISRSPSSPKSESECLYNDAVAAIRPTSITFNYQLVVQKAYEEGEQQLKDDEENDDSLLEEIESGDERTFLISQDLEFHKYINADGNTTIVWKDVSGDDGDKFAFVCDISVSENLIDQFMKTIWKCEFERKYKRSSNLATDADLVEFHYDFSKHMSSNIFDSNELMDSGEYVQSTEDDDDDDDDDEEEFKDAMTGSPAKIPYEKVAAPISFSNKKKKNLVAPDGDSLVSNTCELHFFDSVETAFVSKESGAVANVVDAGKWEYWLIIKSKDKVLLAAKIDENMSPTFNYDHLCFIFNYIVDEDEGTSWLLKFAEFDALSDFQTGLMQALWESLNKAKWGKIKKEDQDYIVDAFNDLKIDGCKDDADKLEDSSAEEEEEEEEEPQEEECSKTLRSGKKTLSYISDDAASVARFKSNKEKNKALAVSYSNERSYVVRGNKIGVFKSNDNNSLDFYTAIENIKNTSGKTFTPERIMLHGEDSSLILKDPSRIGNLYKMDLTKGQVVEEYNAGKPDAKLDVLEVNPTKKFSQLTNEQTFLGLSKNGLFKIDPRISGNNLVESELKQYLSKTNFSAITSTAQGNIAVASKDGEIKLFDRLGINAKTRLPGLGEEIRGLDVSADGRWVLATCSTFLLLIDAQIKEGKNAGTTGFLKSFSKDSKPIPKMLQLLPQHVVLMRQHTKKPIEFTFARFNTGLESKETTIISSSGPYVIRWSLRKILKGDREPYLIKRYGMEVIADEFTYGSDKNAIVTMSDDVALVNKKRFLKPSRETFSDTKRY
ncbi:Vid27 protein [Saccharomycopsis crataegensis]|uniref:Vid27 protein n=1 Tax=Saccharomycopsis crataegensis TaxID=43959 RepID=A0AAV5QT79_9ASCO|nr:Vid27 protein [Saccharomycopsis crataegensis]